VEKAIEKAALSQAPREVVWDTGGPKHGGTP